MKSAQNKTSKRAAAPSKSAAPTKSARSAKGSAPRATAVAAAKTAPKRKEAGPPPTFDEVMKTLEANSDEKTRKNWERMGGTGPMFGVMFKVLKPISMRIGFDQDLASALWRTGNFDARNLASKIADASRITPAELDRWAHDFGGWVGSMYIGAIAAESPHGAAKADEWTRSGDDTTRATGWSLVGQLATRHDTKPDAWFEARLADIEKRVAAAPKFEREAMNRTLIEIGSRSAALRKAAVAASKRIGKSQADRGDTLCRTQDAGPVLDKYWAGAAAAGFASPAAQERARQSPRVRC